MSTDATTTGARRHSTALVLATGLVGLVIGAIAAFVITGLVFTIRVELPPPPYPPPLQSAPVAGGCLITTPPTSGTAPATPPGGFPLPPPHA
jgi:hypothetical protein